MKVEYLGHSCFKLTESTGMSVICDPYSSQIGYHMPKEQCDIVTSSHKHFGHSFFSGVHGKPQIVTAPCHFEKNGITVTGISSFHDNENGNDFGENVIFKFRMDGVNVCHLGDIGHSCEPELLEQLLPVDVLLIPIGGKYTIDCETAFDYVEKLMPDIVIPMHYKTKSLTIDIEKKNAFLDFFDHEQIDEMCEFSIEIDRSDLHNAETKVVVLKRKK